jgi:PAS domain S-box-containing protein
MKSNKKSNDEILKELPNNTNSQNSNKPSDFNNQLLRNVQKRTLIILLFSIFAAESAIMLFIHKYSSLDPLIDTFIDAALLLLITFPFLYFKVIKPLKEQISERQFAEDSLIDSEDHYRTLFEKATDGILYLTIDGKIKGFNESFARMHGYTVEEMEKMNLQDLDVDDLTKKHPERIKQIIDGKQIRFDVQHFHKDGSILTFDVASSLVKSKKESYFIAFHREITKRKIAEDDIKKQAKELNVLLKASQSLSSTLNLGSILQTTVDSITELTDLKSAAIYLLNGEFLNLGATSPALPPNFPDEFRHSILAEHHHILKAIQTELPVFLLDSKNAVLTPAEQEVCDLRNLRSILYLPLKCDDQVLGVLIIASISEIIEITQLEIDMCNTLSNLSAIAVKNSRLYEQAQHDIEELKRAEATILESEINYKTLFESNSDGITIFELKNDEIPSKILDMNQNAYKMIGYSKEETLVLHPLQIEVNVSKESFEKRIVDLKLRGFTEFETTFRHKNGNLIYVEIKVLVINYNNQPALMNIVRDITKRKESDDLLQKQNQQLEQQYEEYMQLNEILRTTNFDLELAKNNAEESEKKLLTIIEVSPVPLALNDDNQVITLLNLSFIKTFGYTLEDIPNLITLWNNAYPDPKYRQSVIDKWQIELDRAKDTNTDFSPLEVQIKCKNGEYKTVLASAASLTKSFEGNHLVVLYDITERKQAEQYIKDSESRLKLATRSSLLDIWDWDVKNNKMVWDERMFELYGINKNSFPNNIDAWTNGLHPEDKQKAIENSNAALMGEKEFDTTFRVLHPDGKVLSLKGNAIVIRDNDGNPIRMIGINSDITEKVMKEKELLLAKNKAEESDKLKTAFLQNISHEIRTPLNGIIGFSNLLNEDNITQDRIKEYTSIIQLSGVRLIEIVNNVLDISRIETGQINIQFMSFAINPLIDNLYTFFTPLAISKNIKLSLNIKIASELIINSDEPKIHQVLSNLISNSIKFTQNGSIEFGCELIDNEIRFFVKDTGIGIARENFEKIFDRFTQADLKITRGYEGAGLGLAICKGLVELLGGKIWIESIVDVGSTFYFTIPLVEDNTFKASESNIQIGDINLDKGTILIAEDDWTSYQYISKLLMDLNLEIIHAENGEKAVEYVKSNPNIILILMDIKMPVMNGIEATKLIKEIRPELPIIAQTAYAFSSEKDEILAMGCTDYISKPILKNTLLQMIKKYV